MGSYLEANQAYWDKGYSAPNVESFVFRPYGRVFKPDFGLDGGGGTQRVLDFGCGEGAALRFFRGEGFDVYGVDIAAPDIVRCKERMPQVADHFAVIDPRPQPSDMFFGGAFDLVISIQTLYYLNERDLDVRLESLFRMLKPGGVFYATMMSTKHWFYGRSSPAENGMRKVDLQTSRLTVRDYYVTFTESEDALVRKSTDSRSITSVITTSVIVLTKVVGITIRSSGRRHERGSRWHCRLL